VRPAAAILLGCLVLGSALATVAGAGTIEPARLVVKGRFVDTGMVYMEGARQYVVVKRRSTGAVVVRREYTRRLWLNEGLAPGRYRLVSYARPCDARCPVADPEPCIDGVCPDPGGLNPPTDRCAKNFRLRRGTTLRALLRIGAGVRCRIRLSPHRIAIRGETRVDKAFARDLGRYLRRNGSVAPWYPRVRTIGADRGVFTVRTTLRRTRAGRAAAGQICDLIQGSDLADFTPGHTIRGRESRRIRVCPERRD
jgi:hypothetical protein